MNELFTSSISDTIVALATAPGIGAISVIRLSGKEAITICNEVFKGKDLSLVETHTAHFGTIRDGNKIIDEVLVTVFIGPKSFTKENIVEVSCHGSPYITKEIIRVFLNHGAVFVQQGIEQGRFSGIRFPRNYGRNPVFYHIPQIKRSQ